LHPCQIQLPTLKLAPFFTLVLGFEFVLLDPQLVNKLPISSIWPPDSVNFCPYISVPFLVLSLVLDLYDQVPNCPPNFNFYAIKPLI
jgi:hypothetical protein